MTIERYRYSSISGVRRQRNMSACHGRRCISAANAPGCVGGVVRRAEGTSALARPAFARRLPSGRLYQVLKRNRQRPSALGEFAEQVAVQIIHVRVNEDSDPSPIAPDLAVSNDGDNLPRARIENNVLGNNEIRSHGFASNTTRWRQSLFVTIAPPR